MRYYNDLPIVKGLFEGPIETESVHGRSKRGRTCRNLGSAKVSAVLFLLI